MTPARMRRIASDYEEVKRNFAGNRNIIVTPIGEEPPEKYHVTYFVNGIYLLPDGRIETLNRHEVEIILHADYPRYKPICRILTPIWHPNFRDGQICIGDIWGAGESLSDIIINIGNMIQYKSWNSFSPLSSEAAQWAIENKHLFPVGNVDLHYADYASAADQVEIETEDTPAPEESDETVNVLKTGSNTQIGEDEVFTQEVEEPAAPVMEDDGNDFEITAEELAGIEFVPTAQRMQSLSRNTLPSGKKINFKTILTKGLLWALIGAFIGVLISELIDLSDRSDYLFARLAGKTYMVRFMEYQNMADDEFNLAIKDFKAYCRRTGIDPDSDSAIRSWVYSGVSAEAQRHLDNYSSYDKLADDALYDSYRYEFSKDTDAMASALKLYRTLGSALWAGFISLFIGLFLGIGEGVYYGSKEKAVLYGLLGAAISFVIGFGSGFLAQLLYSSLLGDDPSLFLSSLIRGIGWTVMGVGIGLAIGLIRPQGKRILFCVLGGAIGAFLGGFLFNFVCEIIPNSIAGRSVGIVIMGILIGVGVGLLEQVSKQAWLKVIRGEFEGKEYLVFNGTTSIGNNGKNTIVLFKDKLVGEHHCDIVQEGSRFKLVDCGTPMGTVVNGMRVTQHNLRQGDAIAIGNSVLVFNTK